MQCLTPSLKKKVNLSDFQIKQLIGKGAYGDVFKVIKDNQTYALKQILKKKLERQKKQYQALIQKQILKSIKHDGVVKLKYTFQDKSKLYFAMEYCHLGEFTKFIKEYGKYFTEELRIFYVAEIVNILQYLHSNGIVHRDLKPQNLLLSRQGHLKLIDFGTCQISDCILLSEQFKSQISAKKSKQQSIQLQQNDQEEMTPRKRRSTFVGTSFYISPQLLEDNFCAKESDLWALGCIIYQLYYMETPFKDNTEYGTFQKIKNIKLEFPKNQLISLQAIDLIQRLLVKNPEERLGSGSCEALSFNKLKGHQYFKTQNIDKVYQNPVPDIPVHKYNLDNEQTKNLKLKQFEMNAKQNVEKYISLDLKLLNEQVLIEGILQRREYPYYQKCYMKVYKNKQILLQMMNKNKIEELNFINQKIQIHQFQQKAFWFQTQHKIKEVFRTQNHQQWKLSFIHLN